MVTQQISMRHVSMFVTETTSKCLQNAKVRCKKGRVSKSSTPSTVADNTHRGT